MNTEIAIYWLRQALEAGFMVLGPILGAALLAGLIVSLFQAITSMQEMTLSFIPKLAAIAIVFFFLLPWMMQMMVDFTTEIISAIPTISK
ncbi:MAG: flagellar biosynthetic protein FliQ [Bacteroidetes bacterium QH_1_61_8]|nr:MAG: flagellar biosynthetic protein FliQ [Bacteroidetes bacterium QH_1_61_8]